MINAGFLNRAEDIQIEARKKTLNNPDLIWKLKMNKEMPYNVAFLSNHTLTILVHYVPKSPKALCNKMYWAAGDPEAHCDMCLEPGYKGVGFNKPTPVKVALGYVFDLVGVTGTTSTGKKFTENPIKIIEISGGKKQVNFEPITDAIQAGELAYNPQFIPRNIWRIKACEEGGMYSPRTLSATEQKNLPALSSKEVPEDTLKMFNSMSQEVLSGYLLMAYGNLQKSILEKEGIIFPEVDSFYSNELD